MEPELGKKSAIFNRELTPDGIPLVVLLAGHTDG